MKTHATAKPPSMFGPAPVGSQLISMRGNDIDTLVCLVAEDQRETDSNAYIVHFKERPKFYTRMPRLDVMPYSRELHICRLVTILRDHRAKARQTNLVLERLASEGLIDEGVRGAGAMYLGEKGARIYKELKKLGIDAART